MTLKKRIADPGRSACSRQRDHAADSSSLRTQIQGVVIGVMRK
jgi:hypothetical protein